MSLPRLLTLSALGATTLPNALNAYVPESPYLQEPETIVPFVEESTNFWLAAWDDTDQAFFSEVNLDGSPRNANKAFLAQSRNAYAFSKAFAVTGQSDYLFYADGALRFMYDFGWDYGRGGWWGQANTNGSINTGTWYNNNRWSFWQHYMLLGISALVEATDDPFHKDWLATGNEINDTEMWDDRPGLEGYYNHSSLNWATHWDKGFTPTVDAITTSALTNYLSTRDPMRKERLMALGDNILYMLNGDHGHIVSFPSEYDNDWNVNTGSAQTSIGHHIKTAWCLARVFLVEPDEAYKNGATQLLDEIWNFEGSNGLDPWDHENGIMRGNINVFSGSVGGTSDWWTVEQGFTSGIMNWYISRNPEYLQMADESIRFFMEHYYDYENGEVFSVVSNSGIVTNDNKGDMFKAGYHSIELFYLLYLYANLYYHNQPVTLYYEFDAEPSMRTIRLWPIAYEDDRLLISGVRRNGLSYSNFDPSTRALTIPAGQSGTYAVTFESRYKTNPPAHFDDNWWRDWFGWYYHDKEAYPWIYNMQYGWCYLYGYDKNGESWFYSPKEGFFFHTSEAAYPAIYRPDVGWILQ